MSFNRAALQDREAAGPFLIVESHATSFVPAGWRTTVLEDGTLVIDKQERA